MNGRPWMVCDITKAARLHNAGVRPSVYMHEFPGRSYMAVIHAVRTHGHGVVKQRPGRPPAISAPEIVALIGDLWRRYVPFRKIAKILGYTQNCVWKVIKRNGLVRPEKFERDGADEWWGALLCGRKFTNRGARA